jgi:hypothetical protein
MNNKKSIRYFIIFSTALITFRFFYIIKPSYIVKTSIMIIAPIFLIWIILKYNKSGRTKKYRLISFSSFGLLMYLIALTSYIDKNHNQMFEKYQSLFKIVLLSDFFLTLIIAVVCLYKIKDIEDRYL